jgi:hypothetical protein
MGDFLASSRGESSGIGSSSSGSGSIAYRQKDDVQSRNTHHQEQTTNTNNAHSYNSGYPGLASSSTTYPDHQPYNNNERKQSQAQAHDYETFAQPRAPASTPSAGLNNSTARPASSSSSSAGNVAKQQQQQQPLFRQDYNNQDYDYRPYSTHYDYSQPNIPAANRKYSNSDMSMDTSTSAGNVAATSQSQQRATFPHQDSNYVSVVFSSELFNSSY